MAEKYYPHDYLPMPLQDGYAFQPVSPLKRTEITTGRARQRRAFISTPTQANVQWFFENDAQAQLYWQFSATLELWTRPVLGGGWAEFPDYIINSSIIDIALNREWPEA